jgi:hypothetical protein
MQQQEIIGASVGEELLDREVHFVRRPIEQRAHVEVPDFWILQDRGQRSRVARGSTQLLHARIAVGVARDDEGATDLSHGVRKPRDASATRR